MGGNYELGKSEILRVYDEHPLRADTILSRLNKINLSLQGITQDDLATDNETGLTDQNHIGGVELLRELASCLGLTPGKAVLDVGSGLGGAGRVLAALYGCQVDGIELSPSRHAGSEELTNLVGLGHRVRSILGDFFEVELPEGCYDVVLGLDTFAHFANKEQLSGRCRRLLKPHGLVAVSDFLSDRSARKSGGRATAWELEKHWLAYLSSWEDWRKAPDDCGI